MNKYNVNLGHTKQYVNIMLAKTSQPVTYVSIDSLQSEIAELQSVIARLQGILDSNPAYKKDCYNLELCGIEPNCKICYKSDNRCGCRLKFYKCSDCGKNHCYQCDGLYFCRKCADENEDNCINEICCKSCIDAHVECFNEFESGHNSNAL